MKRNEDRLRDLWDNIKCTNIHIIKVPEKEEKKKKKYFQKKIFEEIIDENSLKWERKETLKSRKRRESQAG